MHVDAACIYFLDAPARFDVIVTDNMFGDIITDLGAMIQGGMGIAAGGNINPDGVSMFEPIGGTAPSETGKGTINPLAAIGAMEMLLRQLGERAAAERVDRGIRHGDRPDEEHARRRDGLHHDRGRRSRRRGGDRVSDAGPVRVELYDTTLRDGAQQADLSYTVEDRLRILHKLDQVGFPYIEGGWPGANPRDTEFFRLATKETLEHAQLTAFGMTRRAGERAEDSQVLRDLLDAGTEVVCLVGKSWDLHVTEALRTDLDEGVAMVRDSVAFLRAQGRRVFFDAEHFFDGYESDPVFAMAVLAAAEEAGAERLVLCDTNGGMLPVDVARIVTAVKGQASVALGIHVHNDAGCAVANSLVAVDAGVLQVQGTVNGYGERTGNADIVPITADLVLKMGVTDALPDGSVALLTELAHYVAEIANLSPEARQPYAGRHAFTHKAGLHTSGVARVSRAYEHVEPDAVGQPAQRRGVGLQRRRVDPDEGRRVRSRSRRRRDPRCGPAVEGPRVARATPTTWPRRRWSCCSAAPTGGRSPTSRSRATASTSRSARGSRRSPRRRSR